MNTRVVKVILLLASSLTIMANAILSPSLPAMQEYFSDLPDSGFWVRLILTFPALFIVIGGPVAGQIVDRFGRKTFLVISVLLYAAGGSTGLYLSSVTGLLIGRAILGFGVVGIMTAATTLIADYFRGEERARFLGLQAAFMGMGGVVFLLSGGFLADLHWRLPFGVYLLSLILFPFMIRYLHEPDVRLSGRSSENEFDNVRIESRRQPLDRLIYIYIVAFLSQIVFYKIPVQIPFLVTGKMAGTAFLAALGVGTALFFSFLTSMIFGKIRRALQQSNVAIVFLIFFFMGLSFLMTSQVKSYWQILPAMAMSGIGLGLLIPGLTSWISEIVEDFFRGRAMGGLMAAVFLGQFIAPLISQPLVLEYGIEGSFLQIGIYVLLLTPLLAYFAREKRKLALL